MTEPGNHPKDGARPRRLFVALWPDPQTVRALSHPVARAHALYGGRPMRADTLHLTLAFLGPVPGDRIPPLCAMIRAWAPLGGELVLDRFGRFKGPRIVWVGPSEPWPAWLGALHADLWAGLEDLGFPAAGEAFRPHVSLLRRAGPGDLATLGGVRPVVWRPRRCVLVASTPRETGSYYEALAECVVAPGGIL
ncbi:RNA 2',3'-cyclic phosphodiesterase [Castellaniella sp. GW247-6E4]|uniref:RNA 2',3'-cyclic phosphodiesterase n=1 Tax=Castellaniella sp. GW247-6E4 TaxID=3140380 RepID=UPI0033144F34